MRSYPWRIKSTKMPANLSNGSIRLVKLFFGWLDGINDSGQYPLPLSFKIVMYFFDFFHKSGIIHLKFIL